MNLSNPSNCQTVICFTAGFLNHIFRYKLLLSGKNIVVYYNIIHSDVFHLLPMMRFAFL